MKTERVKNSVFNSISNVFIALTTTVLSFVLRTIFIKKLGEQCLGLEGLFTNILSLLSLADLGFSSAISFSLYEPLSKKDNNKLQILMKYFRSVYRKIGIIIFSCGIICMPFLPYMVKGYTVSYNIYIIFLLYLINTSASYFTSYNSVLLEADQKSYRTTHLKLLFNFLVYTLQILSLFIFENFIIYLLVFFLIRQAERVITYFYIKKLYKGIDEIDNKKRDLDSKTRETIRKNIKGILFHKVGDFAVNGTDNILISSIINISMTGLYANYLSVVGIIKTIVNSIINSATASFGNLNVEESSEIKYSVFNVINMITGFIVGICTICFFCSINDFITMWVGSKFLLGTISTALISANIYLTCMLLPVNVVKNSTGLYYIDRYIGIVQAIVNLVISIVFGKIFGLNGILLGTTISYIATVSWTKPYVIYKNVFKKSSFKYIKEYFINIVIVAIVCVISKYLFTLMDLRCSIIITMIIKCAISSIIFMMLYMILYCRTKQFKYLKSLISHRKE